MASTRTADERVQAKALLRAWLPPRSTVHTIVRHRSRSGLSWSIALLAVVDGDIMDVSGIAARAMGRSYDPAHGGIKTQGGGMDMGFGLVYELSTALYPAGTDEHQDGGYVLSHRRL